MERLIREEISLEEYVHKYMKNKDNILLYPDRKKRLEEAKNEWKKFQVNSNRVDIEE